MADFVRMTVKDGNQDEHEFIGVKFADSDQVTTVLREAGQKVRELVSGLVEEKGATLDKITLPAYTDKQGVAHEELTFSSAILQRAAEMQAVGMPEHGIRQAYLNAAYRELNALPAPKKGGGKKTSTKPTASL